MNEEMQNQKKFNQILDTRCNRFENKYKESLKDNDRLTQQLELAAKTLVCLNFFLIRIKLKYSLF